MSSESLELLDEAVVERVAYILGPASAAQKSLEDARARRARGEDVVFGQRGHALMVINKAALDLETNCVEGRGGT